MKFKSTVANAFYSLKIVYSFAPRIASCYTILSFVGAFFNTIQVYFLRQLVDSVVDLYDTGINNVILWGSLYVVAIFLSQIYTFSMVRLGRLLHRQLIKSLTPDIINKFGRIEYQYFENKRFKDIISRMTSDPQQMIHNTFFSVTSCINNILKLLGILSVFFSASFLIGAASLVIGLPMTFFELRSTDRQQTLIKEETEDKRRKKYLQKLFTDKNAVYEIKLFNSKQFLIEKWKSVNNRIFERQKSISDSFAKMHLVVIILKLLFTTLTTLLLLYYLFKSQISFGTFVSLVTSFGTLFSVINNASYSISTLYKRTCEIGYYKDFINFTEKTSKSNILECKKYNIIFKDVHFTYPGTKNEILRGVSFEINTGESVAFVGLNGAGKSTIVKLLCGLYSPTSGTILIDGKNILDFSDIDFQRFCYVVFQDFVSYDLTLRENIAIGNIKYLNDDEKINSALDVVELNEIAYQGLDTNLGRILSHSTNLSKGQWQRIAIARSLMSDAGVIILDEPTASLDPIAESRILESFSSIIRERSAIIVTHRLASAKLVDKIIVIDKGEVVEIGRHDDLMDQNGLYAKLFREQQSWYADDVSVVKI